MKKNARVLVSTHRGKDKDGSVTKQVTEILENAGLTCLSAKKNGKNHLKKDSIPDNLDAAVVVGGDGSIIEMARMLRGRNIPILGVNMGTLGYLAEVEVDSIPGSFRNLLEGNYYVEDRMMLEGSVKDHCITAALNDIVISRKGSLRVIHFELYVNGEYLCSYEADGIIVATPTGSTAYSLSAGGPIVEPTADIIIITPICAHALQSSSIILSPEDEIVIEVGQGKHGRTEEVFATFDGAETMEMVTGDTLRIKRAEDVTKLIKLEKDSFLEILSRKMREK